MDTFGFPRDLDEAKSLTPYAIVALAIGVSILIFRNSRFTGLAPDRADDWGKMIGRMLAVVAALFLVIPPGPLGAVVGLFAALLLICNGSFERHLRIVAMISLAVAVFPSLFLMLLYFF